MKKIKRSLFLLFMLAGVMFMAPMANAGIVGLGGGCCLPSGGCQDVPGEFECVELLNGTFYEGVPCDQQPCTNFEFCCDDTTGSCFPAPIGQCPSPSTPVNDCFECQGPQELCCFDGICANVPLNECQEIYGGFLVTDCQECQTDPDVLCCDLGTCFSTTLSQCQPPLQVVNDCTECQEPDVLCCDQANGICFNAPISQCVTPFIPVTDCNECVPPQPELCCDTATGSCGPVPAGTCTGVVVPNCLDCEPPTVLCCDQANNFCGPVPVGQCPQANIVTDCNDCFPPPTELCCDPTNGFCGPVPVGQCLAPNILVADCIDCEQEPEPEKEVKFIQLPLDGRPIDNQQYPYYGHDEISTAYTWFDGQTGIPPLGYQGCFMADDFADPYDTPVICLKWWGSYLNNQINQPVTKFLISFEADVPADDPNNALGYSHPGEVLSSEIVTLSSASCSALTPGEYNEVPISPGGFPCNETLYEYCAVLKKPFPQEPHTVYWLKIVAIIDLDSSESVPFFTCMTNFAETQQISFCEAMELPDLPCQPEVTRWGWHNRDYRIMNPVASTAADGVVPGESIIGSVVDPAGVTWPVWHFQDDAVSGDVFIDDRSVTDPLCPLVFQGNYIDEYYVHLFTNGRCFGVGGVDGPVGIEEFSKDLAFELLTELPQGCDCLGDLTGDGIVNVFDLSALSLYLQTNGVAPFYAVPAGPGDCCDLNGDGVCNVFDLSILALYLQNNGAPPFYTAPCIP